MFNKTIFLFPLLIFSFTCFAQDKFIQVEAKRRVPDPVNKDERNADVWESFPTRTVGTLQDFQPSAKSVKLSKYGGVLSKKTEATGFFYTKRIGKRWWLVDPEGHLFIHAAVNSVHPGGSDRNKLSFAQKFGNTEKWVAETKTLLTSNGFNGLGCWSDTRSFQASTTADSNPVAYTMVWNFMSAYAKKKGVTYIRPGHTGYLNDVIYVFDPEFETFCDTYAQQLIEHKNDKNILGHFSDNEMPFKLKNLDGYLSLDKKEPGYKAAKQWLELKKVKEESITDSLRHEFLAFVGDRYFSIVSKAIKKYDPNHLYLGSRFHSSERYYEKFLRASSPYIDVVSINYYRVWTPEQNRMQEWDEWMNKPFMVTEYYVKGEDSGLPNKTGAGWLVRTQKDRGYFYQNFNLALLEAGNCVGWHYFKYQDNDPEQKGAELSNVDSNKGIVDNHYNVYKPMMTLMMELNQNMYQLIDFFDSRK